MCRDPWLKGDCFPTLRILKHIPSIPYYIHSSGRVQFGIEIYSVFNPKNDRLFLFAPVRFHDLGTTHFLKEINTKSGVKMFQRSMQCTGASPDVIISSVQGIVWKIRHPDKRVRQSNVIGSSAFYYYTLTLPDG